MLVQPGHAVLAAFALFQVRSKHAINPARDWLRHFSDAITQARPGPDLRRRAGQALVSDDFEAHLFSQKATKETERELLRYLRYLLLNKWHLNESILFRDQVQPFR